MSGTEDSILNSIPDFQQPDTGDDDGGSTGGTEGAPSQGGTSGGDARTSAQPTQTGQQSSGTQPQPGQQQFRRRHDGLIERPNADNPNARDLVDPVTGRTVAQGGIERRVFEEGQRHARENTQLKTQLQQVQGAFAQIGEVTREAARLNVKPEDQIAAIRVMSDFLRDPVRTLEYLVAEVKAKGYPIPFLEQGVSPGMDMTAIGRMIDQKMQPITQQHQETVQQQRFRQQAEAELNGFLNDNQDAAENLDVLSEMLQAQPTLTVHQAYTRMIRWAHENGLDWTQPLKPQVAALNGGNGQQPTHQQPNQQPTQRRPLPGRRSGGNGAQPVNGPDTSTQFNENASWADIIRSAMQENNVRFN